MFVEKDVCVRDNVEIATRQFLEHPNGAYAIINNPLEPSVLNVLYDPSFKKKGFLRGSYSAWLRTTAHNLLTDAGRDFLHLQGYETTGLGSNGLNYIAVSTDGTAPADGDTTLTSEITTGGLSRVQGTVAHTVATAITTVITTFTASATHTSVQKSALFSAASVGTMGHEAIFSSVSLIANDQLQITWTITLND